MTERRYKFGGIGVTLRAPVEMSEKKCLSVFAWPIPARGFLINCGFSDCFVTPKMRPILDEPYRTVWAEERGETGVLRYQKNDEPWPCCLWTRQGKHISMWWKPEFMEKLSAWQIIEATELFHLVLLEGGVVLHGSYVVYKGKGIVFSAPSGTGKSTQAALWEQFRGAEIINGDRCLLYPEQGGVSVHGICYSGTSHICKNVSVPLQALVLLGQAPENQIRVAGGIEAFRFLMAQCAYRTWDKQDVTNVMNILTGVLSAVPVFRLDCRPDESAVEILEKML